MRKPLKSRALAVSTLVATAAVALPATPAGASSGCRTVDVLASRQSKVNLTPCERINVGFEIGTQGDVFPTWDSANRPAGKIVRYVRGGYENTDNSGGTTTQYFLYRALTVGRTTLKFCESTASQPGCLETYQLHVIVRRPAR